MPPLASVNIPVFLGNSPAHFTSGARTTHVTPQGYNSITTKGKAAIRPLPKSLPRRTYDASPLPIKPVEDASRAAEIEARSVDARGVWYAVRTGETVIDGISIERILDHVSPQHLEEFEMQRFEEEGELIRIVEAEDRRLAREEAAMAKKQRAKRKGRVIFEEISDEEDDGDSANAGTAADGARPRPTYKSMFKQAQKIRRRRKRDPRTGMLMPLSDHESDEDGVMRAPPASMSSSSRRALAVSEYVAMGDGPKRRRRKRDPKTGELLPLSSELKFEAGTARMQVAEGQRDGKQATEPLPDGIPHKRPRRRRHPQTGALMPLGWKWEGEANTIAAQSGSEGGISPSMNKLTLSQEQQSKRRKLGSSDSSSQDIDIEMFTGSRRLGTTQDLRSEPSITVSISASDESVGPDFEHAATAAKAHVTPSAMQISANYSVPGNSQISNVAKPALPNSMTSMLHPTPREQESSSEDNPEQDELDEDEFFIEAVLAHHLSDPRTHDRDYGSEPVMLYKVSWLGDVVPKTTWEPIESFPDLSIVHDYHRRAGLRSTDI